MAIGLAPHFRGQTTNPKAVTVCPSAAAVRYYQEKMDVPPEHQAPVIAGIVKSYVEGLCWVMRYYYEGVASWEW